MRDTRLVSRSPRLIALRAQRGAGVTSSGEPTNPGNDRLRGWKEIGAFLHASDRTAQRWERALRLPVHRIPLAGKAIVFATRHEIDAWLESAEGRTAMTERERTQAVAERTIAPTASKDRNTPSTKARRRRTWSAFGAAPLLVVSAAVLALGTAGYLRQISNRPAAPEMVAIAHEASASQGGAQSARNVVLRVVMADGSAVKAGVTVGGFATHAIPGRGIYALSADSIGDGARIHVSRFERQDSPNSPVLTELGVWSLRPGECVTMTNVPGIASLQLERPRASR